MTTEFAGEQTLKELQSDPEFMAGRFSFNVTQYVESELERTGTTKAALADRMGVSRGYVSKLLTGPANLQVVTIYKIAFALDVVPRVLFNAGQSVVGWDTRTGIEDRVLDANAMANRVMSVQRATIQPPFVRTSVDGLEAGVNETI